MKTFEEAYRMFQIPRCSLAEAHDFSDNLTERFRSLIDEVVSARFVHEDIGRIIRALLTDNVSSPDNMMNAFASVGMTALMRGIMVGIEMERGDPLTSDQLSELQRQDETKRTPKPHEMNVKTHQIITRRNGEMWTVTLYYRWWDEMTKEENATQVMQWEGTELYLGLSEASRVIHGVATAAKAQGASA